jgi:uncharacterized protein with PQ loop repeat
MSLHAVAVGTGYVGSALGVAMVVPQIVRTLRDRTMPGVSALSWALTALACSSWLLYGVRTGEMPQVPGNVLLISGAVAVALLVPSAVRVEARVAALVAAALVIGAVAAAAPLAVLDAVAIGMALISSVPQTVATCVAGPRTARPCRCSPGRCAWRRRRAGSHTPWRCTT